MREIKPALTEYTLGFVYCLTAAERPKWQGRGQQVLVPQPFTQHVCVCMESTPPELL